MKMQTNYGVMDLEERNGKTRLVRGGVAGTRQGNPAVAVESAGSSPAPSPSAAVDPFDSKLEALRHRHLSMLVLAGEVKRFQYHPFTIAIGPGKKYTPDFLVEYPDGRIVIEEVKGSLKMKNARDSVTRLHVAAGQLPMFSWRLVVGDAMEERLVA